MAKIAKITAKQYKAGVNEIGWIAEYRPSYQRFTQKELDDFDIVDIDDSIIEAAIYSIEFKTVYRIVGGTSSWSVTKPRLEEKRLWRNRGDASFKELKKIPQYLFRHENGRIVENISLDPNNTITFNGE